MTPPLPRYVDTIACCSVEVVGIQLTKHRFVNITPLRMVQQFQSLLFINSKSQAKSVQMFQDPPWSNEDSNHYGKRKIQIYGIEAR
jgi:hypothetical protein